MEDRTERVLALLLARTVLINEAIDLSKQYSTADSKRFINGILDRMKDKLGRDSRKPETE